MNKSYVYIFVDHNTGKPVYVGKGTRDRDAQHVRNAKNGLTTHLYNWMRKYKERNNIWPKPFRIKDSMSAEEAFSLEKELIAQYGRRDISTGCLFNHTDGGEGLSGRIPWNKGMSVPIETRVKISEALRGKVNKGRVCSVEHRINMSIAQKRRYERERMNIAA